MTAKLVHLAESIRAHALPIGLRVVEGDRRAQLDAATWSGAVPSVIFTHGGVENRAG
jgi:hypothetical protein